MTTVDRRTGYWNREKETMKAAARERYQAGWLSRLLEHAWAAAPGVRRRLERAGLRPQDIRGIEKLARLPVLKKSEMPELQKADPPFGGFCAVPPASLRRIFVSPGPILEPMGSAVSAWHAETCLYAGGFRPGDVVLDTYLYHLVPAAHEIDEALMLIGCTVVPTGVGNTDTQVMVARALGATGYVGTPSFLMTILKRAREMGGAKLSLQVAQVGAEPLPETLRAELEAEYGILTRQGFGTADLGLIAYECPEKSGMHLVEDAIVQVCDPQSGEPLPPGRIGEIVATVDNPTYPMIRFATGDLTMIDDAPCPCGRTSDRMLGWRGRADEVTKVRGMFVHPRQADEVAARVAGLARYQVVVTRVGHEDVLTFRVELTPQAAPAAVTAPLVEAIRDVMKLRGTVEIVPPGTIPDGAKKISDERTWR
ncbi:MAG TPA: AMP-binding protein [Methylomirabilota bacterium]|nr:AMP-binding protein [Methylomirabilota bacterium]